MAAQAYFSCEAGRSATAVANDSCRNETGSYCDLEPSSEDWQEFTDFCEPTAGELPAKLPANCGERVRSSIGRLCKNSLAFL